MHGLKNLIFTDVSNDDSVLEMSVTLYQSKRRNVPEEYSATC